MVCPCFSLAGNANIDGHVWSVFVCSSSFVVGLFSNIIELDKVFNDTACLATEKVIANLWNSNSWIAATSKVERASTLIL